MYKKMVGYCALFLLVFSIGNIEPMEKTKRNIKQVGVLLICRGCEYSTSSPGFFHAHKVAFHGANPSIDAEELYEKYSYIIKGYKLSKKAKR